ncbi:hypothetical protein Tco_1253283 [Tanacetum coccineum]
MAALVSCPKHNMVACLEKTKRNAQFHEIVDFLTRSSIYYSLTVSPTVSTSLIEQFWNTTTSKTVNDVSYIKAKVAGKTILISEASIRRNLLFNDVDGIDCLTNQEIYENRQLIGHVTPLFPNMLAQAVVDEGEGSANQLNPNQHPLLLNLVQETNPLMTESSYRPDTTQVSRDSLEGTDRSKGYQVLDLQKAKMLSLLKIFKLKKRIKKAGEEVLGKKESVSKQGRKNAKSKPTLDAFDDLDADLAHGMDYMETEEAVNKGKQSNETEELNLDVDTEVIAEDKGSCTAGVTISTADPEVSVVEPRTPPTTTSIFDDEDITMAQTLIKMKEEKAKEKGVAFKDVEDLSRPVRSITTLKPLPSIDPKDKGKGILLHEEELVEIERIEEEKVVQEKASRVAIMEMFDEVQAGIDVDALAAQRAAEIRSRPPTKSQLRNLMMTYLKNMGDDEVKDSKKAAGEDTSKKEEILKEHDSTKIESMNKEDAKERVSDVSKKRKGGPRMKRMSKRKKTESDLEEEEDLKTFLKIVPDKEGIINYEVLEKRFPIINWESKFYHYDRHGAEGIYYRIFRSDGSSRWIKTFSEMVTRFDRPDLVKLYNLVMQRIKKDGILSWNLYENCGVHTLTLEDGTEIHMLAKRKYPLTKETLERMMSLKLIVESASDSAYDLLRFIQKQIDEAGSHDEGEKDL